MKDKAPIYFIVVLILLLSIFTMIGCSPKWHIKRAIRKDPTILVKDTINYADTFTVYTEHVQTDSVFIVSNDTTTIIKDNLTIRHFISRDSVFIYGECASDTIFITREIKVPFDKVVINDPLFPRWLYWVLSLMVILFLLGRLKDNKKTD